jgi:hypothetical protein
MIYMSDNSNNHVNGNGRPMLRPAIIIGAGGTGNQVVRRLKKFVQDQYGAMPSLLSFLVLDTDESTFNDQNWARLPALGDNEKLSLYDSQVPFLDVRENPGAYPEGETGGCVMPAAPHSERISARAEKGASPRRRVSRSRCLER